MDETARGITCLAVCDSSEDSKSTLLRALLISCKYVHPKHVHWLGFLVKPAAESEHYGTGRAMLTAPTPAAQKHNPVNVSCPFGHIYKECRSFLSPPYHRECSAAGIYQSCSSNLKKCSRGKVRQHFSRDLWIETWVNGIPGHREPSYFPTDAFPMLL